jgi:hypothetical protein
MPTAILTIYLALVALVAYLSVFIVPKGKAPSQLVVGLFMCTVGFIFSRVTLRLFDPWYLAKGHIPVSRTGAPGASSVQTGGLDERPATFIDSIRQARSIEYLSQKVNRTGSVKSIGLLVEHARGVEAVARLYEHGGYETTRYPRDQRLNPLQLGHDLYARKGAHRVFTSVRMRGESPGAVDWSVASELNAAISTLADGGETEGAPNVEARLVLVAAEADDKLDKFVQRVRKRGVRIEVVALSEQEVESCARAKSGDPVLGDALHKLRLESVPGSAAPDAAPLAGGAA